MEQIIIIPTCLHITFTFDLKRETLIKHGTHFPLPIITIKQLTRKLLNHQDRSLLHNLVFANILLNWMHCLRTSSPLICYAFILRGHNKLFNALNYERWLEVHINSMILMVNNSTSLSPLFVQIFQ